MALIKKTLETPSPSRILLFCCVFSDGQPPRDFFFKGKYPYPVVEQTLEIRKSQRLSFPSVDVIGMGWDFKASQNSGKILGRVNGLFMGLEALFSPSILGVFPLFLETPIFYLHIPEI